MPQVRQREPVTKHLFDEPVAYSVTETDKGTAAVQQRVGPRGPKRSCSERSSCLCPSVRLTLSFQKFVALFCDASS